MGNKFKTKWFYASIGKFKEEKGIIFKKTVDKHTHRYADFDEYANVLQNIYEEFDADGYDVVNVVPLAMGTSEDYGTGPSAPTGLGFSITRGAVVVGKKRERPMDDGN